MLFADWTIQSLSEIVGLVTGILAILGAVAGVVRWITAKAEMRGSQSVSAPVSSPSPANGRERGIRFSIPELPVRAWLTFAIIPTVLASAGMLVVLVQNVIQPEPGWNVWTAILTPLAFFLLFYGLRWLIVWRRAASSQQRPTDYSLWTVVQAVTTLDNDAGQ